MSKSIGSGATLMLVSVACPLLTAAPLQAVAVTPDATESSASTSDALMEEVVVTARKREERSQDVPISISAFSGPSLEAQGIERIDGIANITPNMTYQNNPSFGGSSSSAAIYIRGIGQKEFLLEDDHPEAEHSECLGRTQAGQTRADDRNRRRHLRSPFLNSPLETITGEPRSGLCSQRGGYSISAEMRHGVTALGSFNEAEAGLFVSEALVNNLSKVKLILFWT